MIYNDWDKSITGYYVHMTFKYILEQRTPTNMFSNDDLFCGNSTGHVFSLLALKYSIFKHIELTRYSTLMKRRLVAFRVHVTNFIPELEELAEGCRQRAATSSAVVREREILATALYALEVR